MQQVITESNIRSMKSSFCLIPQQIGNLVYGMSYPGLDERMSDTLQKELDRKLLTIFRYHFLHSLALFTVQFSSIPKITAALFISGQLLFCVPAYSQGFGVITLEDPKKYAMPFGGTSFMLGWLTHVL